jgi:hypothetical protein
MDEEEKLHDGDSIEHDILFDGHHMHIIHVFCTLWGKWIYGLTLPTILGISRNAYEHFVFAARVIPLFLLVSNQRTYRGKNFLLLFYGQISSADRGRSDFYVSGFKIIHEHRGKNRAYKIS